MSFDILNLQNAETLLKYDLLNYYETLMCFDIPNLQNYETLLFIDILRYNESLLALDILKSIETLLEIAYTYSF